MKEYRCTRNQPYLNPKYFGFTNLEARQGYYVKAESEKDARAIMQEAYPDDEAGFTAHLWEVAPQLQPDGEASEPDVDDSLPEWADYYSNWQDYVLAEMPEAINPDLALGEF